VPSPVEFYPLIAGKRVIIVSQYADEINEQFKSGNLFHLYKSLSIARFELLAIEAPLSIFPNAPSESWSQSYRKLLTDTTLAIEQFNGDTLIASCGCYGLPLCHEISNRMNIDAMYFGHFANFLFGVLSKASEGTLKSERNETMWRRSSLANRAGVTLVDGGRYI
jgi:hypothetical protein